MSRKDHMGDDVSQRPSGIAKAGTRLLVIIRRPWCDRSRRHPLLHAQHTSLDESASQSGGGGVGRAHEKPFRIGLATCRWGMGGGKKGNKQLPWSKAKRLESVNKTNTMTLTKTNFVCRTNTRWKFFSPSFLKLRGTSQFIFSSSQRIQSSTWTGLFRKWRRFEFELNL